MRAILRLVRDGWLMLGLAVMLFLAIEATYRGLGALRSGRHLPSASALPPEERLATELGVQEDSSFDLAWRPYVYYRRRPFRSRDLTVDSAGMRHTPQPRTATDAPTLFLFGGSTTWGSFQRGSFTLASVLARRLHAAARPVRVVNFGETGYVHGQEVLTLQQQLLDGQRPAFVVFYDGINEVAALAQNRRAGWPQNEGNRRRDWEVGRRLHDWRSDLVAEGRAMGAALSALANRLHVVKRLRAAVPPADRARPVAGRGSDADPASAGQSPPDSALAIEYVAHYLRSARAVRALGREFGFRPLFVWQPTLHSTGKPLAPGEAVLLESLRRDGFGSRLIVLHRVIGEEFERRAALGELPDDIVLLTRAFDTTSDPIYVDGIGHTYERANPILADSLLPRLLHLVATPVPRQD
jgi:hypothetical protein